MFGGGGNSSQFTQSSYQMVCKRDAQDSFLHNLYSRRLQEELLIIHRYENCLKKSIMHTFSRLEMTTKYIYSSYAGDKESHHFY